MHHSQALLGKVRVGFILKFLESARLVLRIEVDRLWWLSRRMASSFVDCVLWEISRHMLCWYLIERDWSYLHHQWWQGPCTPSTENLGGEQQTKWGYSDFVCTCIGTHLLQHEMSLQKLGALKLEGIHSKGTYFQGFTVNMYQLTNFLWHKLWRCVTRSYVTWAHIGLSAKVWIILGDNNKIHCFTGNFFYLTMHASAIQNVFIN